MSRSEFDAESAVLRCVMDDPQAYWQIADLVAEEDFQRPETRAVWRVAVELIKAGQPADAVTIGEFRAQLAEVALEIQTQTPASVRNVRAYAGLLGRRGLERKVRTVGQRIASLSGEDVLGEAQRLLATCAPRGGATVQTLGHFAEQSMAALVERAESTADTIGVPTGFEELDAMTGGWQPTDLIVLAARPSVGKTAFALQSTLHAAGRGHPAMFVSLEMNGRQLADRALAHLGGVNSLHIRDPRRRMGDDDWGSLGQAKARANQLPVHIDESAAATVDAIAARVRQKNAEVRLGLVVIDYLTYIRPPKAETQAEAIQEITRALKALAKELQIPVLLLAQLNRDGDGEPEMVHLRGSGAIEQDADVVMFLHRPNPADRDYIKAKIAKQRNGPLGEFYLRADMARMRFHPAEEVRPVATPRAPSFESLGRGRRARAVAGDDA